MSFLALEEHKAVALWTLEIARASCTNGNQPNRGLLIENEIVQVIKVVKAIQSITTVRVYC